MDFDLRTFPRSGKRNQATLKSAPSLWSVKSLDSGLVKDSPWSCQVHPSFLTKRRDECNGWPVSRYCNGSVDQRDIWEYTQTTKSEKPYRHPTEEIWKQALKRSKSLHLSSIDKDSLSLKRTKYMLKNGLDLRWQNGSKACLDQHILERCLSGQGRSQSVMNLTTSPHSTMSSRNNLHFTLEMLYNMCVLGYVQIV